MSVPKRLYKNLTLDEKIALLHYERGSIELCSIDHYQSLKVNPNETPKVNYLYISNVLGIDFEEFYGSDKAQAKSVKFKKEIKARHPHEWHIGDAITSIIYEHIKLSAKKTINADLIETIDAEIKDLYEWYTNLGSTPPVTYKYEEYGFIGGEKVYRRLTK